MIVLYYLFTALYIYIYIFFHSHFIFFVENFWTVAWWSKKHFLDRLFSSELLRWLCLNQLIFLRILRRDSSAYYFFFSNSLLPSSLGWFCYPFCQQCFEDRPVIPSTVSHWNSSVAEGKWFYLKIKSVTLSTS